MGRVSLDRDQGSTDRTEVTAARLLGALGERLGADGWNVALVAPPGAPPALKVMNPAVPMLRDQVMAALMADGSWWFWWSFGERVAGADDVDQAVAAISRVLGLSEPPRLRGAAAGSRRWPEADVPAAAGCGGRSAAATLTRN